MSEKRFHQFGLWVIDNPNFNGISIADLVDTELMSITEVVNLLNEQQSTIQRMKHSLNTIYKAFEKHYGYDMRNAVWLIDELSYDEIVDELYIAETDSKNRKEASMYWKKKVDEQQATITHLEKVNGKNFAKRRLLEQDNLVLRNENEQLRKDKGLKE